MTSPRCRLLVVAPVAALLVSLIALSVRCEGNSGTRSVLQRMVREVSELDYSVLQILVDRSRPDGFRTDEEFERAVAYALSSECFGSNQSACFPCARPSFNKLFEANIQQKCAKILPVYRAHKAELADIMRQPGVHEESRLERMGFYCDELTKKPRRAQIFKQFSALLKANKGIHETRKSRV